MQILSEYFQAKKDEVEVTYLLNLMSENEIFIPPPKHSTFGLIFKQIFLIQRYQSPMLIIEQFRIFFLNFDFSSIVGRYYLFIDILKYFILAILIVFSNQFPLPFACCFFLISFCQVIVLLLKRPYYTKKRNIKQILIIANFIQSIFNELFYFIGAILFLIFAIYNHFIYYYGYKFSSSDLDDYMLIGSYIFNYKLNFQY